jgi:hypothetical protein
MIRPHTFLISVLDRPSNIKSVTFQVEDKQHLECKSKICAANSALPSPFTSKDVPGQLISALANITAAVPAGLNPLHTWNITKRSSVHECQSQSLKTPSETVLQHVGQGSQLSTRHVFHWFIIIFIF